MRVFRHETEPVNRLTRRARELAPHWPILVIAMLFAVLGVVYSFVTPIFETPDEPWHLRYIKRLADGQGLPPIAVSTDEWEQGEVHQPPLYYALAALFTRGVDTGEVADLYERNPYAALGLPHAAGNKNAVVHRGGETPPYSELTKAVHRSRWLSLLFAVCTVILTYAIAHEMAPNRRSIAIGSALVTAFNPQFLFIAASASNDSLVTALATGALLVSLRVVGAKSHPWKTPIVLGLLIGLASLTKLSGLTLICVAALAYGLQAWRSGEAGAWRRAGRALSLVCAVVAVVAGWWYLRNALLYGDPFGMQALSAAFSKRDVALPLGEVVPVIFGSIISYWGVFGWMNVLADEIYYTFVRALCVLSGVGLLLFLIRSWWYRHTLVNKRWPAVMVLACWILIMVLSLAQWTLQITGPQGRFMFPAIAGLSFFLVLGLASWVPRRWAPFAIALVSLIFVAVATIAPFRYIQPAYAQPQRMTLDDLPADMQDLQIGFGDELVLLGYQLVGDGAEVGERLHVRLYWIARKRIERDYTFFVHVLGRSADRIGGLDTYPGGGNLPTTMWLPGDVICEDYEIDLDPNAQAPVAAQLRVGVYERDGLSPSPVVDAHGQEIEASPMFARARIATQMTVRYLPPNVMAANFADKIALTGYDISPPATAPGGKLNVYLYWETKSRMTHDYTVFLHLVDTAGATVAQLDSQPFGGEYPTTFWRVGEALADPYTLVLPDDLDDGEYTLRVGFYWLPTNERLPLLSGEPGATYESLGPIVVRGED